MAPIAAAKPTPRATSERRASRNRRWTTATQTPASGPNSGPTTIAPMIRISESVRIPTAAISVARTMNATKEPESSADSDVRSSTSSHTTASAGAPRAISVALRAS